MDRPDFIKLILAAAIAPAIIKVEMLMPVHVVKLAGMPQALYGPELPASMMLAVQKMKEEINKTPFWPNFIQKEIALGHEFLTLETEPSGRAHLHLYSRSP